MGTKAKVRNKRTITALQRAHYWDTVGIIAICATVYPGVIHTIPCFHGPPPDSMLGDALLNHLIAVLARFGKCPYA